MNRRLVCLEVPTLAALSAAEYVPPGHYFALLLLFDARGVDAATIGVMALRLLDEGVAAFEVWGPDCERVHDIVDESCVERDFRDNREYPVVMTGWFTDCPLEEALWGVLNPFIDEAYEATCDTTLIVTVANERWDREIRHLLHLQAGSSDMP